MGEGRWWGKVQISAFICWLIIILCLEGEFRITRLKVCSMIFAFLSLRAQVCVCVCMFACCDCVPVYYYFSFVSVFILRLPLRHSSIIHIDSSFLPLLIAHFAAPHSSCSSLLLPKTNCCLTLCTFVLLQYSQLTENSPMEDAKIKNGTLWGYGHIKM